MEGDLDGVYTFKNQIEGIVPAACYSNCIYSRVGSEFEGFEYCFQEKTPQSGSMIEECEAHPKQGEGWF